MAAASATAEPEIAALVLGAAAGSDPGPLVTHFSGIAGQLPCPLMIVPGGLDDEALDRLQLTTGQTVLVLAAAGNVGAFAVQLAKRRGATVIAQAGAADHDRLRARGAATAVGATGIGPSVMTLRQYPDLVDRAAAAGRVTYCWTVDEQVDVQLCADLGVRWLATNHPAKVRDWLVTVD